MTSLSLFAAPVDATGKPATMSSNEIAGLTGKRHGDVIRDVRVMIDALQGDDAKLRHQFREEKDARGYTSSFHLDYELTLTLVTGYDVRLRNAVINRWQELEQGAATASITTLPTEAAPQFKALFELATLIGCDTNAAAISANQGTIAATGLDLLGIMGLKALPSPDQAIYYTPTELGKQCTPVLSAIKINARLYVAGLQHNAAGHWEATEAGKPYARTLDTGKKHNSGVPVQQVKWLAKVLEVAGMQK